ncbi:MAG: hypothetical protein RLZZ383_884 [Pseudomonadota bacterium]
MPTWVQATIPFLVACATPPPPSLPDKPADTGPATSPEETDVLFDTAASPPALDPLRLRVLIAPDTVEDGQPVHLELALDGASDLATVTVGVRSDRDGGLLPFQLDPARGVFVWDGTLSPGQHTLNVRANADDGRVATLDLYVGICQWPPLESFDASAPPVGWTAYGAAYLEPAGWLEITGNTYNRRGAYFRTGARVNPGDVRIVFDIATGGGDSLGNSGADGYALSVVDVPDVPTLEAWINSTAAGGCLGYGSVPPCSGAPGNPVNAFHIEFDTWYNGEYGDQSQQNHIAVALDGNPTNPIAYLAVPNLEDLVWRTVEVRTVGQTVEVYVDGRIAIQTTVPGFQFDGGYIGVSGSTGSATNEHRFDNLRVYDRCVVP